MTWEPFQPPAASPPPRRRRLLPALLVGAGVLIAGAGAVVAAEPFERDLKAVKPGGVAKADDHLRSGKSAAIEGVMTAPTVLGVKRSVLESIAECESHGDPRAKSSDGLYRGKYQFHRGTWASVGGKGDPARAPEFEQDVRAAALYKRSSSSPWPICG
jgi:hypothetical protein